MANGRPISYQEVCERKDEVTHVEHEPDTNPAMLWSGPTWVGIGGERRLVVLDEETAGENGRNLGGLLPRDHMRFYLGEELSVPVLEAPSSGIDIGAHVISRTEIDSMSATETPGVEAPITPEGPAGEEEIGTTAKGQADAPLGAQANEEASAEQARKEHEALEEQARIEAEAATAAGKRESTKTAPQEETPAARTMANLFEDIEPWEITHARIETEGGQVKRCTLSDRYGVSHAVDLDPELAPYDTPWGQQPKAQLPDAVQYLQDELKLRATAIETIANPNEERGALFAVAVPTRQGEKANAEPAGNATLGSVSLVPMNDYGKVMALDGDGRRLHPCPSEPRKAAEWLERLGTEQLRSQGIERTRDDPLEEYAAQWHRQAAAAERTLETRLRQVRPRTISLIEDSADRWRLEGTGANGENIDLLDGASIRGLEAARKIAQDAARPEGLDVVMEARTATRADVFAPANSGNVKMWKKLGWPHGETPATVALTVRPGRGGAPIVAVEATTADGRRCLLESPQGYNAKATAKWLDHVSQAGGPIRSPDVADQDAQRAAHNSPAAIARANAKARWPATDLAAYDVQETRNGMRELHPNAVWCAKNGNEHAVAAHQVRNPTVKEVNGRFTVMAEVPSATGKGTTSVELCGAQRGSREEAQALRDRAERSCALAGRAYKTHTNRVKSAPARAGAQARAEHTMGSTWAAIGGGWKRYAMPIAAVTAVGLVVPLVAPVMTATLVTAGAISAGRWAYGYIKTKTARHARTKALTEHDRANAVRDWRTGTTTGQQAVKEHEGRAQHVTDYTRSETLGKTPEGVEIAGSRQRHNPGAHAERPHPEPPGARARSRAQAALGTKPNRDKTRPDTDATPKRRRAQADAMER